MSYLSSFVGEFLKFAASKKFFDPGGPTRIKSRGFGAARGGHHTERSLRATQLRESKPTMHQGVPLSPEEQQAYQRYLADKAKFQNKPLSSAPVARPSTLKPQGRSGSAVVFTDAEREAYRKSLRGGGGSLAKEAAKRTYTATDLDRASRRQDLEAQQFRKEYKGAPPTPEEREAVRELAQRTISLPIQKGKKVSLKQWMDRILQVLVTRRPEVREKILLAIKEQLKAI